MPQNEPNVNVYHRIAEAVGKGWPPYEVTPAEVEAIIDNPTVERRHRPLKLVDAVLAEAHTYSVFAGS